MKNELSPIEGSQNTIRTKNGNKATLSKLIDPGDIIGLSVQDLIETDRFKCIKFHN